MLPHAGTLRPGVSIRHLFLTVGKLVKLRSHRDGLICPGGGVSRLPAGDLGFTGVIQHLAAGQAGSALSDTELESRLIELGFVEGARVEVLHEGIIGRDPIAVRVENVTIAVRRREAMAIIVA